MSDSVFTEIIKGQRPSFKIFEDEYTYAFLARESLQPGHTLIVPKIEVDYFVDVPEPYYSAVFQNAKIISKAIHKATNCKRVGTISAGWDIPHFHYHLVPMFDYHDLDPRRAQIRSREDNLKIQQAIIENLK